MSDMATRLARAALRAFFGTDSGFEDMDQGVRAKAVKAVRAEYIAHEVELVEKDLNLAMTELESIVAELKTGMKKL